MSVKLPGPDSCTAASICLFDHRVGEGGQRPRAGTSRLRLSQSMIERRARSDHTNDRVSRLALVIDVCPLQTVNGCQASDSAARASLLSDTVRRQISPVTNQSGSESTSRVSAAMSLRQ